MSERTCEIDGKKFEGVQCIGDADSLCTGCAGCAGYYNQDVCIQLGDCLLGKIIWVVKV